MRWTGCALESSINLANAMVDALDMSKIEDIGVKYPCNNKKRRQKGVRRVHPNGMPHAALAGTK